MKNLKELNLIELKKLASKNKIEGRSKMNKNELIKNLNKINKMKGGENKNINRSQYKGKYLRPEEINQIMKNIKSGNEEYYYGSPYNPEFYEPILDMNFKTIENQYFYRGKNNKNENIFEKENAKVILQLTLPEDFIVAVDAENLYLIGNVIYDISTFKGENINGKFVNYAQLNINKIENKHKNNWKNQSLQQVNLSNYY